MNWEGLFFALLALALATLWIARQYRAATRLPRGRIVYADTTRWRPVERPLFSRSHRLTGRPDYLVRRRGEIIPVEVKSGRAPSGGPHISHILQLAAYGLLVELAYDNHPPYGIIQYDDQAYEIDYTPALKQELLAVLEKMREALAEGGAARDHDQSTRCQACGFRANCNQSLV